MHIGRSIDYGSHVPNARAPNGGFFHFMKNRSSCVIEWVIDDHEAGFRAVARIITALLLVLNSSTYIEEGKRAAAVRGLAARPTFPLARILLVSASMSRPRVESLRLASPALGRAGWLSEAAHRLAVRDGLGSRSSLTVSIGNY